MLQGPPGCRRAAERRSFCSRAHGQALEKLAARLRDLCPAVMALEAIGGFEAMVAAVPAFAAVVVNRRRCAPWLGVSFQQVVHPVPTGNAEVIETSVIRR